MASSPPNALSRLSITVVRYQLRSSSPAGCRRPGLCRTSAAAFVVKDNTGQKLGYVYFGDGGGCLQHDGDEPKTLVGGGVTGAPF
jgi:hypothetical protein